ncbi:hypothetical protein [Streptomyces sp. HPF1205]|uniref:hypothetical protein n=1 Tax=Streptomyces sp. HPF1205 TaxID=2873262 RepID=UPI001CECEFDB|nr:hypothetical protein [Streptomyces sp. HPF1205]
MACPAAWRAATGDLAGSHASVTGQAVMLVGRKSAIGVKPPWAAAVVVLVILALVFPPAVSAVIPPQALLLNATGLTAMSGRWTRRRYEICWFPTLCD